MIYRVSHRTYHLSVYRIATILFVYTLCLILLWKIQDDAEKYAKIPLRRDIFADFSLISIPLAFFLRGINAFHYCVYDVQYVKQRSGSNDGVYMSLEPNVYAQGCYYLTGSRVPVNGRSIR